MIRDRLARSRLAALRREAASRVLGGRWSARLPVRRLHLEDPALDELLVWLSGSARPGLGVMVGPPRANRKPVLRLFSADGRTTGYAKMGINDLTNELVDREAAALSVVSSLGLPDITVPAVLKHGSWRGHSVLLTSPLALVADLRAPEELPVAPTRSLFTSAAQLDVPLRAAPALAAPGTASSREGLLLEQLAHRLMSVVGDQRVPLGASHGDWTPWNMAWSAQTLEVWDWERYDTGVPQGLDAVHFGAQKVLSLRSEATEPAFLRALPRQLERCDIAPALTTTLLCAYLVVIGRRYASDLERAAAPTVLERLHWVIGLLGSQVELLEEKGPR